MKIAIIDFALIYFIVFFCFQVEENMLVYTQSFDIVIIEDESLDVVNGIMKKILNLS